MTELASSNRTRRVLAMKAAPEQQAQLEAVVAAARFAGKGAEAALGATVFFWARVAYWAIYLAGVAYVRTAVWFVGVAGIVLGAVLISAIFSWVNPYAPMAGIFNALTNPLLRPFRRIIPPVGGIDLSPLALLLVLQIALFVLASLRQSILPAML